MSQEEDTVNDETNNDDDNFESSDELFESMLAAELSGDSDDEEVNDDDSEESSSHDDRDDEQKESDDEDHDETETPKSKTPDSVARTIRRLQESQARIVELEKELRAVKSAPQPKFQSTGDILDDLISLTAARLGVKDDDPKVRDALFDLGGDLIAELHSESDDPAISARRNRREMNKRERAVQAQIDELKQRNEAAQREVEIANGINDITSYLNDIKAEKNYPYLYAAEDDVPRTILEGIWTLTESGHQITSANVNDTINFIVDRINSEHKARLIKLEKLRGGKDSNSNGKDRRIQHIQNQQRKTETHGAQKSGQTNRKEKKGGRTVTASGVSQRVAKRPDGDGLTGDDLFESMLQEEIKSRNRNTRRR